MLEDDVDHAGDGVGAVLSGGAFLQHFDMIDRHDRDHVQVGGGRALILAAQHVQVAGGVAALAVDQHQRVVGGEAAQARRQGQGAGVAAQRFRREGRGDLGQGLDQVGLADMGKRVGADDGDGGGAVGGGHAGDAGAGDNHRLGITLGHGLSQRWNGESRQDKE